MFQAQELIRWNIIYRLETNFEEFRERAKNCVKESLNEVYSPSSEDAHYITFSPYDKELHGPIKQDIYKPKVRHKNK